MHNHLVPDTTGTSRKALLAINNHLGNVCPLPHRSMVEEARMLSSSPEQNSTPLTQRPCFLFFPPCPASFRKYLAPSQQVSWSSAVTVRQFSSVLLQVQSRAMLDPGMKPYGKKHSAVPKLESVFQRKHMSEAY